MACVVQDLGNLGEQDAYQFFTAILKLVDKRSYNVTHWRDIFRVCGGNIGLLKALSHKLEVYDDIMPGTLFLSTAHVYSKSNGANLSPIYNVPSKHQSI